MITADGESEEQMTKATKERIAASRALHGAATNFAEARKRFGEMEIDEYSLAMAERLLEEAAVAFTRASDTERSRSHG